jgi:dipeptidyl aminopeptidase/acylaminoacyl peptidase
MTSRALKSLPGVIALISAAAMALPAAARGDAALIPRETIFGNPERSGVQISPDGRFISYLAPLDGVMNVWVEPAAGGAARSVTRSTQRPISSYAWASSSAQILYAQDQNGDENDHVYAVDLASGELVDLTPFPGVSAGILDVHRDRPDEVLVMLNQRDPRNMDVHRVHTRTAVHTPVYVNEEGSAQMVPDDDWVVRVRTKFLDDGGVLVEMRRSADDPWRELLRVPMEDSLTTSPIGFSRDGTTLYAINSIGRDTGAFVAMRAGPDGAMETEVIFSNPRADVSDAMVNPVTGLPEAVASTHLRREWKVLDPAVAADLAALAALDEGELEVLSRTRDDRAWIVAYLDDDRPVRYWLYPRGADGAEPRFLFENRRDLENYTLAEMLPVEITARDGLVLPSYLTLPAGGVAGPMPMVLLVHGGPWGRDEWGYHPYHQWLANRGYAVLSVNFRGSTGFGKRFVNAGNREWAGKMQDDLTDAVQWAIDRKVADPSRVAIMGGSYGGYATLVGMTFTPTLYACGVDIVGPSHVRTLLSTIPPYWAPVVKLFESRVGGLDEVEFLDRISPLTHVDEIERPLLIGQGQNDPRVKVSESDQIVAAMQSRDLPVTYVVFPDEGHGFARPENTMAFNAITETFLARHLGGRVEPLGDHVARSTAQVRSFGDLHLPGVAAYVPGRDDAPEPAIVKLEELTDAQRVQVKTMLESLEQRIPPEMRATIKSQLESQIGMVPEADRPMLRYILQELERMMAETAAGEGADDGKQGGGG